jgi:hypothetical protein
MLVIVAPNPTDLGGMGVVSEILLSFRFDNNYSLV